MVLLPTTNSGANCGCECGKLPYTITATLSGLSGDDAQRQWTKLYLTSCTGGGAMAVPTAGGGCDGGQATALAVTDGGCCYAVRGRKAPQLVPETTGHGRGIVFGEIQYASSQPHDCGGAWSGLPWWKITSIPVTVSGAHGYQEGDAVTVRPASGGHLFSTPDGAGLWYRTPLTFERLAPQLTAAVADSSGTGAQLTVTTTHVSGTPDKWVVSGITVQAAGSGYVTGQHVRISQGDDTHGEPGFDARITADDGPPPAALDMSSCTASADAAGAKVVVAWESLADWPNVHEWAPASLSVVKAGSGYSVGDTLSLSAYGRNICATVDEVDDDGGIVSCSINWADNFPSSGGPITGVTILTPKHYWKVRVTGLDLTKTYIDSGVKPLTQWHFYQEDPTAAVTVPTITVRRDDPGVGATVPATVTVNQNPTSPTFGQVTAVALSSGADVPAWQKTTCHGNFEALNSVPFVLRAVDPVKLLDVEITSCFGSGACAEVETTTRVEPELTLRVACERDGDPYDPRPCCSAETTVTTEEHTGADGLPYWAVSGATASGGHWYTGTGGVTQGVIVPACDATVIDQEAAVSVSLKPGPAGEIDHATVLTPGRYWTVREWDGTATGISRVNVVNGGQGYAVLGREEPEFAFATTAWGFSWSVEVAEHEDECGRPYWSVESASVENAYFADGEIVQPTAATEDDVIAEQPVLRILSTRVQPFATVALANEYCGDSTAEFSIEWEEIAGDRPLWRIASITGTGHAGRHPSIPLVISPASGPASAGVAVRNAVAVAHTNAACEITHVVVYDGGAYYNDSYLVESIEVVTPGKAWRNNPTLPAIVANVSVALRQIAPSSGTGAALSAVVGSNPLDPATFGKITAVNVTTAGSNYLLLGGPTACAWQGSCVRMELHGHGKAPDVSLLLDAPQVVGGSQQKAGAVFRSTSVLGNCNALPSSASLLYGGLSATVTMSPGGSWDNCDRPADCTCDQSGCCENDGTEYVPVWPGFGSPWQGDACECTQAGGTWTPGGHCGCCCVDGEPDSSIKTECECDAAGGTWHGDKACSAELCLTGCCCIDGEPDATKTTQQECVCAGGFWHYGLTCETVDCACTTSTPSGGTNSFGGCSCDSGTISSLRSSLQDRVANENADVAAGVQALEDAGYVVTLSGSGATLFEGTQSCPNPNGSDPCCEGCESYTYFWIYRDWQFTLECCGTIRHDQAPVVVSTRYGDVLFTARPCAHGYLEVDGVISQGANLYYIPTGGVWHEDPPCENPLP